MFSAVVLTGIALSLPVDTYAQPLRAHVSGNVQSLLPTYARPTTSDSIVYRDGPFELVLRLHNPFPVPAAAEPDWFQRLVLGLHTGDADRTSHLLIETIHCELTAESRRVFGHANEPIVLEPHQAHAVPCLVPADVVNRLKPGFYSVSIAWDEQRIADNEWRRDSLGRVTWFTGFEFRDVARVDDFLEARLQELSLALREEDYEGAVLAADKVLAVIPESSGALAGRGKAMMGLHRCAEAARDLDAAARSLESGTDRGSRHGRSKDQLLRSAEGLRRLSEGCR
jgi:hypothetical protein